MVPALTDVLDTISRAVDPHARERTMLGAVRLHAHQVDAVRRARAAIAEFGGALVADAPGLGKTFVALGVAAGYSRCVVAAPASLRPMWLASAEQARVAITFVSLEALSRGAAAPRAPLVVVDEAHRVASHARRRYDRVARMAHHAHLLLLTATPVRNHSAERADLLALFLGGEARHADDALVSRCIIRRDAGVVRASPGVARLPALRRRGGHEIAAALRSLPPPLPAADGVAAAGLVRCTLARSWASSMAALDDALARRLQRGAALASMLAEGRLPRRHELRAWTLGDDAMQLAFSFVASPTLSESIPSCLAVLTRHVAAVAKLRDIVREAVPRDTAWRARILARISARHPDAVVIAFTAFEATARALYGAVARLPGTVLLSGHGARSAGGQLARSAVLASLASGARLGRRDDVRLVIATDVLSEGANLQRASVIVHLDDPWTPASVEQRVGRAARLGSTHATVFEYRLAPPLAAQRLLSLEDIHRAKRVAARRALVPAIAAEALRTLVRSWRAHPHKPPRFAAAACYAACDGFIATVVDGSRTWVVAGGRGAANATTTDDPVQLLRLARAVTRDPAPHPRSAEIAGIARAAAAWIRNREIVAHTGAARPATSDSTRLLRRLDELVTQAEPSERAAIAVRVEALRARVGAARGAETERAIARLLAARPETGGLLDAAERLTCDWPTPSQHPLSARAQPHLAAVLLLRRRTAASQRSTTAPGERLPSPAPPATSTETAGPR